MIDATILIPTYRHAALLPYAIRSALAQEGASIELFVVGDGVEDDSRAALDPFLADPRVRFLDLPKGERSGELNRHAALADANGRIACYLSDDDLLLPCHVATMLGLLDEADFAHSAPFFVEPGDVLTYIPFDLSRKVDQARLGQGDWNAISLTGAAHTLAAYRRLPRGWRPAPPGAPTDLHMWQQFLELPDFRGVTATELTHLHFPSPIWNTCPLEGRVSSLASWSAAIHDPAGRLRLARMQVAGLRAALAILESSRTWRLRNRLLAFRPVRALVAWLPAAR